MAQAERVRGLGTVWIWLGKTCNGSIVLLHYFTDPCSYLHWSITNTHDMIHKCDTPQWIHVLIFFQLKAFTFLWHTGKNSLLTTNLLSHTEEVRLLLQCEALSVPEFILNFIIIVFSCKYFSPFCQLYMSNDLLHPVSALCFFTTSHIMAAVHWWLARELT